MVFRAIRSGKSVSAAAREADVHRRLIYAWCERGDAELKALLDERRAVGTLGRGVAARSAESDAFAEPPERSSSVRRRNWLAGQEALVAIAGDPDHKDRVKAAEALVKYNDHAAKSDAVEAPPVASAAQDRKPLSSSDAAARFRVV